MKNARQRAQINRAEMLERRNDGDLAFVLSDARGRRFLWRELGRCGLHAQTYSPNNSEHCFKAGERNAAIRLNLDVIRVSPEMYLLMQQEAMAEDEQNQLIDQQETEDDD